MVNDVLILGLPIYSYAQSVCNAFKKNGINSEVLIFKIPNIYLKNIPLVSQLYFYWYHKIYPRSFFDYCLKNSPRGGLLVLFGINYLTNDQLRRLKAEKGMRIVTWFIDSIYTFPWFYKNIEVSDYILCYNKSESIELRKSGKNAIFFPMAYDQTFFFPIENCMKEFDLYFIGTLSSRSDYFEELIRRLRPLNLKIRIDGPVSWFKRKRLKRKFPLLSECISGKGLSHSDINELYNKSHICLSLLPAQANSGFSPRNYEICGSGALQLTNGNRELLDTLFKINTELFHFDTMESLVEKIKEIIKIKNSDKLREVRKMGFRRALNDHTFERRVDQLLQFVNENRDPDFEIKWT